MEEEQLKEIQVIAERIYPGRTWDELTPEEQESVFKSYAGEREMAGALVGQGQDMMAGASKEVGPLNVYVNNPYEQLAGGLMAGYGYGQYNKANKSEEIGRKANADLLTNRDARDRVAEEQQAAREEERRRQWMQMILRR